MEDLKQNICMFGSIVLPTPCPLKIYNIMSPILHFCARKKMVCITELAKIQRLIVYQSIYTKSEQLVKTLESIIIRSVHWPIIASAREIMEEKKGKT